MPSLSAGHSPVAIKMRIPPSARSPNRASKASQETSGRFPQAPGRTAKWWFAPESEPCRASLSTRQGLKKVSISRASGWTTSTTEESASRASDHQLSERPGTSLSERIEPSRGVRSPAMPGWWTTPPAPRWTGCVLVAGGGALAAFFAVVGLLRPIRGRGERDRADHLRVLAHGLRLFVGHDRISGLTGQNAAPSLSPRTPSRANEACNFRRTGQPDFGRPRRGR